MPERQQDEREGGPHHPDVEPAVEEVLLILHEPQLEGRRRVLGVDLTDLAEADQVHADLDRGKYRD